MPNEPGALQTGKKPENFLLYDVYDGEHRLVGYTKRDPRNHIGAQINPDNGMYVPLNSGDRLNRGWVCLFCRLDRRGWYWKITNIFDALRLIGCGFLSPPEYPELKGEQSAECGD